MGRQAADGAAKGTAAAAGRLNGRLRAVEGAAAGRRRSNLEGLAAAALDLQTRRSVPQAVKACGAAK